MKAVKRYIALILCVLPLLAQSRTFHHEFGEIKEEGGVVKHVFTIPAEKRAQSVVNAFVTCPCLKVNYDKAGVAAGKGMKIEVAYDPAKQQGHFTKYVYLKLNDSRRDTLMVTGTVKRVRPVIDRSGFPEHFGMGFMIDRREINFGTVRPGEQKSVKVPVLNGYEAGMALDVIPEGKGGEMLSVPYGLKLGPGGKSKLEVRLSVPKDAKPGAYGAVLVPCVHGMRVEPVPVKFTVKK